MAGLPTSSQNQAGCTPVASNCVIWQGPNIPCIQLCTGDSISDVTAKLAQQLCNLIDQVDLSNFAPALLCFDPICPALTDFEDLINFILNQLCALKGATPGSTSTGCPDTCLVTIAPCFQTVTPLGDTVTQMTLVDYARAIGTQVCSMLDQLVTVNATLVAYNTRITALETATPPAPYVPPTVTFNFNSCNLATGTLSLQAGILAVASELCMLESAVGDPQSVVNALSSGCSSTLAQAKSLGIPGSNLGQLSGWISPVPNLASFINNMMITICDLRNAVTNLATCCGNNCDDVIIHLNPSYANGVITLNPALIGNPPFNDMPSGSTLTITDLFGNLQILTGIPLLNDARSSNPIVITLNSNMSISSDYVLSMNGLWQNTTTGLMCDRTIVNTIVNVANCPSLTITPGLADVSWSFTNSVANGCPFTVYLLNNAGSILQTVTLTPALGLVSGIFNALSPGTPYKLQIGVNPNSVSPAPPLCTPVLFSTIPSTASRWVVTNGGGYWLQSAGGSKWLIQ